jgi:Secretin and TonB N terminus short domain
MLRSLAETLARSSFCHAVIAAWMLLFAFTAAYTVAEERVDGRGGLTAVSAHFDIPSQPLEDALMSYAAVTGVEVFVDHALAADQKSAPVQGVYTFEEALRALLRPTGLYIRRAADQGYTLVAPAAQEPPIGRMPEWSADPARNHFFTALQTALKRALCASPQSAPGQYRAAIAIWIGPAGDIVDARVLGADVEDQAASNLAARIVRVSVGEAPPPGLEQPVTFVILPRSPEHTRDCQSQGAARQ